MRREKQTGSWDFFCQSEKREEVWDIWLRELYEKLQRRILDWSQEVQVCRRKRPAPYPAYVLYTPHLILDAHSDPAGVLQSLLRSVYKTARFKLRWIIFSPSRREKLRCTWHAVRPGSMPPMYHDRVDGVATLWVRWTLKKRMGNRKRKPGCARRKMEYISVSFL